MTTVTKLYDTYAQARNAVSDLEASGISHGHISIVASNADGSHVETDHTGAATGAATGGLLGGGAGLLAGLGMLAIPGVGPVVAAGWLVATAAGAAVGATAGGLAGSLTDHGVSKEEAHVYAEGVRRGGAIVSVKTDENHKADIEAILNRHKYVDPTSRETAYRSSGWSQFDPDAPPYTAAQIEAERARYR